MRVFKLAPVTIMGRKYQISHKFTDAEITELMMMPKVGKKISFSKAYELRYMELTYLGKIFNSMVQCTSMIDFLRARGYYVEFEEGELEYGKTTTVWN